MTPTARVFLAAGGIAGFAAVALGAFGAHALKGRLSPEMFAVWHTAVEYHVFHALVGAPEMVGLVDARRHCPLLREPICARALR